MRALKYFMWGYQPHFQLIAQSRAKELFERFEADLQPTMFLVGLLHTEKEGRFPICVEPQDCPFQPELLEDIWQEAEQLELNDGDRMLISHPVAAERYEARKQLRYLRDAIRNTVAKAERSQGHVTFCSTPTKVDDYMVACVLQLDQAAYSSYPKLTQDTISRCTVTTSFLDSVIDEYLSDCSRLLSMPEPGLEFGGFRGPSEMLRAAGRRLMETPALAVGNVEALGVCFEACNTIASLTYESEAGRGRIVFASPDHPNVECVVSLLNPVGLREYRAVRKMLQMAARDLSLLSNATSIYGLGREVGAYDASREDLFTVDFVKHHDWELCHAGQPFMRVIYGEPSPPRTAFNEKKFRSHARRIFDELSPEALNELCALARLASEQKHGTMLVLTPKAAEEAERLRQQATRIKPVHLSPDVLHVVTGIDGAVLLDVSGTCHAIGVILDGRASAHGTPSRGARYNSAIRYVDESDAPCMAIVVSEDGTVDVVPDLRPQLPRASIELALAELRDVASQSEPDHPKFNKLISWFNDHRFYLSGAVCDEINRLKRAVEERLSVDAIRVVYNDFSPHTEMDDSYLV
jgi:hypothetical protein